MASVEAEQLRICRQFDAEPMPPAPGTKVGIALETLGKAPIHGVRTAPTESTCGWYIHAGDDWSDAVDFYQPLCVEHLVERCPPVLRFLALPPGWRFMTDEMGFEDAWFEGVAST